MADVTGLTVVLPQSLDSLQPIEIHDRTGLKSILVERYALDKLPQEWVKAEGFYVLLSHINPDNTFTAYIGQTDYSFTQRLKDHTEKKDFWRVAILFKRETDNNPFTRTETRYLEGLLHDALKSSPNVTIINIKPVGEKNMPDHNKPYKNSNHPSSYWQPATNSIHKPHPTKINNHTSAATTTNSDNHDNQTETENRRRTPPSAPENLPEHPQHSP